MIALVKIHLVSKRNKKVFNPLEYYIIYVHFVINAVNYVGKTIKVPRKQLNLLTCVAGDMSDCDAAVEIA